MGTRFSQEIAIDRVDLKTKSKIRDYLTALNLDYNEMRENTECTFIIDVEPIVGRKQVLHDLLVFLQNEKFKTEMKSERKRRQKSRQEAAPASREVALRDASDSSVESVNPLDTPTTTSQEDLCNLIGVSEDSLVSEEDSVALFAQRCSSPAVQLPPVIEESWHSLAQEESLFETQPCPSPPPEPVQERLSMPRLEPPSVDEPPPRTATSEEKRLVKKRRARKCFRLFTACCRNGARRRAKRKRAMSDTMTSLDDQLLADLVSKPGRDLLPPPQCLQVSPPSNPQ